MKSVYLINLISPITAERPTRMLPAFRTTPLFRQVVEGKGKRFLSVKEQDDTWLLEVMEFIFACSTRYLTRSALRSHAVLKTYPLSV